LCLSFSQAIDAGVKALKTGSVSDADVARGKAQLKAETLYFVDHVSGMGYLLGNQAKNGDGQVLSAKAMCDVIDSVQTGDCRAVSSRRTSLKSIRNSQSFCFAGPQEGRQLKIVDWRCWQFG
jgi:hypothetical protein